MSFAQTRHMPPLHGAVGYFSLQQFGGKKNNGGYFSPYLDFTNFTFDSLQLQQVLSLNANRCLLNKYAATQYN